MLKNRLSKNWKKLKKWASQNNFEAFRIYDRDLPEYPYIIDLYGKYSVTFEKGNPLKVSEEKRACTIADIKYCINDLLQIPAGNQFLKLREKKRGKNQYGKVSEDGIHTTISEGAAKYLINLSDYLDTGVFLDHRPIRKKIYQLSGPQTNFLNLFSYTGTASVMSALNGARTTNVDMSKTYLNWTKENFLLNEIDPKNHSLIHDNVLNFLKNCRDSFDLILLDPPTFSNSKRMENDFKVMEDQFTIVDQSMELLNKGGELIFSNNNRSFKLSDSLKEKYQVSNYTKKSIPYDFRDTKIHQSFIIKHL
ncbi:MAG: methyltransferase [Bacteriovoracaceae bacterium]|nr:methyltransferase [Bacteriovoracaceae bacterium]